MPHQIKYPLLVSDLTNIFYLTGFLAIPEKSHDSFLLVTPESDYIFTNSLYLLQAEQLSGHNRRLKVGQISGNYPFHGELISVLKKHGYGELYVESTNITAAEYLQLVQKLNSIKIIPHDGDIEKLRLLKSAAEIAKITKACKLSDSCYKTLVNNIRPGIYEKDIVELIENFARNKGCQLAFMPIVAFGENTAYPHYAKANQRRKLRTNDVILIDFGMKYDHYCSDMTRMLTIGKVSTQFFQAADALLNLHLELQQKIRSDLTQNRKILPNALDQDAKNRLAESFPPFAHSLGHGIGLDIHEAPRFMNDTDSVLGNGMVFTLEPAVYLPGKFGIRLEDTVAIVQKELIQLTHSPKKIFML